MLDSKTRSAKLFQEGELIQHVTAYVLSLSRSSLRFALTRKLTRYTHADPGEAIEVHEVFGSQRCLSRRCPDQADWMSDRCDMCGLVYPIHQTNKHDRPHENPQNIQTTGD